MKKTRLKKIWLNRKNDINIAAFYVSIIPGKNMGGIPLAWASEGTA